MRFRHFSGLGPELDKEISDWIQDGSDIHFMSHSQLPDGTITVCIVYQESFAAEERRITQEQGLAESAPIKPPVERIHVESEGVG